MVTTDDDLPQPEASSTSFYQKDTIVSGVEGISELIGSPRAIEAPRNLEAFKVSRAPELIETSRVTVASPQAIAEWRQVHQEQDEEYEKSLQLHQKKVATLLATSLKL